MSSKPKLAIYWAAGCGGCEIAFLEIQEHLLELAGAVDLVFCPCLVDTKYGDLEAMDDDAIDLCLFNGSIRTEENVRLAQLLRRRSRLLVSFGACAAMGGIPGLANISDPSALLQRVYLTAESVDDPEAEIPSPAARLPNGEPADLPALWPRVDALSQVVPVDYLMPGCPPEGHQVWQVCQALLAGDLPPPGSVIGAGEQTVCEECPLHKHDRPLERVARPHEVIPDGTTCLLEQGILCLGIGTRSGCRARCPSVQLPCRGCYGPSGRAEDAGLQLVGALGGLLAPTDEQEIRSLVDTMVDPVGTLYRFGLPGSSLGGRRPDHPDPSPGGRRSDHPDRSPAGHRAAHPESREPDPVPDRQGGSGETA
jgi:F420-non-reducing hydrogenase small subunit